MPLYISLFSHQIVADRVLAYLSGLQLLFEDIRRDRKVCARRRNRDVTYIHPTLLLRLPARRKAPDAETILGVGTLAPAKASRRSSIRWVRKENPFSGVFSTLPSSPPELKIGPGSGGGGVGLGTAPKSPLGTPNLKNPVSPNQAASITLAVRSRLQVR